MKEIKEALEYAKLSIESFNAEVSLTPSLIDGMLNVIGEVERLEHELEVNEIILTQAVKSEVKMQHRMEQLQKALKTVHGIASEEFESVNQLELIRLTCADALKEGE